MSATFGTVCSGVEAASLAWAPLGWRCAFVSEIEAAPIAVLTHRHDVQDARRTRAKRAGPLLWGDFASLRVRHLRRFGIALPDVLAGGTPCQSFSIAGKRGSLADPRGNLSLAFVRLAHAIDRARAREGKRGLAVVWENVPGCLSTADNAFGCLLAGFVGADAPCRSPLERGRWPDAGLAAGPRAWAAWRVLDAQYFGLAQRRCRVILVVGFRDALDPGAILFERAGVHWDTPPRRKARQDVAGTLNARTHGGGGLGTDFDLDGGLVAGSLSASAGGADDNDAEQGRLVAHTLNAKGGSGGCDAESETFVTHALTGEGFDASEDGTGRGTPIVPVAFSIQAGALRENPDSGPDGAGVQEEIAYTLEARPEVQATVYSITPSNSNKDYNARETNRAQALTSQCGAPPSARGGDVIAFSSKDHGADAGELAPTLRAGGHDASHANGGVMPAVAINLRGREGGAMPELDGLASLRAADGGSSRSYVAQWAVRRLTPRECERLQGMPDDYTLAPHRGKPMADGPRYKMIGNSWAVPVFAWVGARLDAALRAP